MVGGGGKRSVSPGKEEGGEEGKGVSDGVETRFWINRSRHEKDKRDMR
jgi:hypothetical protein